MDIVFIYIGVAVALITLGFLVCFEALRKNRDTFFGIMFIVVGVLFMVCEFFGLFETLEFAEHRQYISFYVAVLFGFTVTYWIAKAGKKSDEDKNKYRGWR